VPEWLNGAVSPRKWSLREKPLGKDSCGYFK
jgi:hypothetical protein